MLLPLLNCSAVSNVCMPIIVVIPGCELGQQGMNDGSRGLRDSGKAHINCGQLSLQHHAKESIGHIRLAQTNSVAPTPIREPLNFSQSRRCVDHAASYRRTSYFAASSGSQTLFGNGFGETLLRGWFP
jgi:hypothetical protein